MSHNGLVANRLDGTPSTGQLRSKLLPSDSTFRLSEDLRNLIFKIRGPREQRFRSLFELALSRVTQSLVLLPKFLVAEHLTRVVIALVLLVILQRTEDCIPFLLRVEDCLSSVIPLLTLRVIVSC